MRLLPGQVHVWSGRLDVPADAHARLTAFLSDDERARTDRLRAPVAARRFAAARGLLRSVLSRYLSEPPGAVAIAVADGGKPYLARHPVHFSVSHSGDVVAFAVGGAPVGIDVECLRPSRDVMHIARRFFAPEEADALARVPAAERLRAFYVCWTRKEAYLKARGVGLAEPMRSFVVPVAPGPSVLGPWRLFDLDLEIDDGAVGTLATTELNADVVHQRLS